jgi:hypothetical protein
LREQLGQWLQATKRKETPMKKVTLLAAAAALALITAPAMAKDASSHKMTHPAKMMRHHARTSSSAVNARAQAPADDAQLTKACASNGGGKSDPLCRPGMRIKEFDGQYHPCQ